MRITKVNIINYKLFEGKFSIDFQEGINIIVGNNEAGKSTILEAIHLALTGIINGRYINNEINQYLFNSNIVNEYLDSLRTTKKQEPPKVTIEIFLSGDTDKRFEGNNNSERSSGCGIVFKIEFDEDYNDDYNELLATGKNIDALPIEFYKTSWYSFSMEPMKSKTMPVKSILIDSSSVRNQNSSDLYISRIIQNNLNEKEKAKLSQAYREIKGEFGGKEAVVDINDKIKNDAIITTKAIEISAELPTKSAWETALMTFVNDIPFHQIGKGEQCIVKTNLALSNKKDKEASLILLEEPESHLTYSKMSELISNIEKFYSNKQIIITTHSNFVMNKLDIKNVILLNNNENIRLDNLDDETYRYFKKLSGYPTLRLLLCKKAVLVEGDSDELIFQKAYFAKNKKLPIQDGIDVLSVGLSFKRFLEITAKIQIKTAVLTDNDGDYENNILKKYKEYNKYSFIKVFYDTNNELNTLEPQFANANKDDFKLLSDVLGINFSLYDNLEKISKYMKNHKTDWALKVFETGESLAFPGYIIKAVDWCNGE